MAVHVLTSESKQLFPLSKIDQVVELFSQEIEQEEPNLAVLSIILGAVEHNIVNTTNTTVLSAEPASPKPNLFQEKPKTEVIPIPADSSNTSVEIAETNEVNEKTQTDSKVVKSSSTPDSALPVAGAEFPALDLDEVIGLYEKFQTSLITSANPTLVAQKKYDRKNGKLETTKDFVKNVSDIVWGSLSKSYNADKPHLQTLYTYLTGNKLDSFGVVLAVVAGAQVLGLQDVHLALSEDHAWVTFGQNRGQNLEVTWHGKGIEDKRGSPVGLGDDEGSWLYLNGHPVTCDRHMEVAALVASINPTISGTLDSKDLSILQQRLLWVLYDTKHLQKYPMALGNLAHLEEIKRTPGKRSCEHLFEEAILCTRAHYDNRHVYPYINYGGYFYRSQDFRRALGCWADAADVMRHYGYTRNDEDIYTQFLDITKDNIVSIMKQSSSGISASSILRDPGSFAALLRFCDGLCQWEENSRLAKLVIHIAWAKCWSQAIGKFDSDIRKDVRILSGKNKLSLENGDVKDSKQTEGEKLIDPIDFNGNREISTTHENKGASALVTADIERLHREVSVELTSQKMLDVKELVQKTKLNMSALTLTLTAQAMKLSPVPSSNFADGTPQVNPISSRNRKSKTNKESVRNDTRISKIDTEIEISEIDQPDPTPPKKRVRK